MNVSQLSSSSSKNSDSSSTSSLSLTSVAESLSQLTINDGKSEIPSSSSPALDPFLDKINNFISQLKYKKTFQDDDKSSANGKYASLLSAPQVSMVIINIFGKDKMELKVETREMLAALSNFFKEYIAASKMQRDSKVEEILMELFHNPDMLVFQQTLVNDPLNWCTGILPILKENIKKKVLVEQLEEDVKMVQTKRREMSKDKAVAIKRLKEVILTRNRMVEKINPNNLKRLTMSLEQFKIESQKLQDARDKRDEKFVTNEDVTDLLSRFQGLKGRHKVLKDELKEISANMILPPDIEEATKILTERKAYLDTLVEQISNPLNNSSFHDSVFMN